MRLRYLSFSCGVLAALTGTLGCAAGPEPIAFQNRVFYEGDAGSDVDLRKLLEKPWDPLDWTGENGRIHDGIEVLGGVARISRPQDWIIRRGSIRPEGRFIEYVSPRQVAVSIYERLESPRDPWGTLMGRYQADTKAQGGEFLGEGVPFATWDNQARAYDVRRGVPIGKEPLVAFSREYLVRSEHRVVLVQIVRPREPYGEAEPELIRLMSSLTIL